MTTGEVMRVTINFYSYFRDLAGCADTAESVAEGATIRDLLRQLVARFPKLEAMQNSMLIAIGLEYQTRDYKLKEGDQVSLFPPVQGG
ncbi:MAG: MoaD/ThiS family protein [Verrucomicrobia subdivision 3 bacterium]|nr:MoaD/ThiS family protein [Limisphaerales bacterium]